MFFFVFFNIDCISQDFNVGTHRRKTLTCPQDYKFFSQDNKENTNIRNRVCFICFIKFHFRFLINNWIVSYGSIRRTHSMVKKWWSCWYTWCYKYNKIKKVYIYCLLSGNFIKWYFRELILKRISQEQNMEYEHFILFIDSIHFNEI